MTWTASTRPGRRRGPRPCRTTGGSGIVGGLRPRPLRTRTDDADDLVSEPPQRLRVGEAHEAGPDDPNARHLSPSPDFWPVSRTYIQARASTMPPVQHLAHGLAHVDAQQQPVEHGEDQRAEDRAGIPAGAAEDRRAADHRRRHRWQQVAVRLVDADGAGGTGEQQPTDGREQSRQDVHRQQHLPHPHAGEPAGDRVVTNGVDHPTETRRAQPPHEQHGDHGPHDEVRRQRAVERPGADVAHEVEHVRRAGQPAAQPDGDDAQQDARHAQRHDQRVDPEHADRQPVDEPHADPDADRHGERGHRARSRSAWPPRRRRGWRSWRSTGRCHRSACTASGWRRRRPAGRRAGGSIGCRPS